MVTINKIIEQVDEVILNTFDEEMKFHWLANLDGQISRLVLQSEEPVVYEYPKDMDRNLLVDAPFDGIYAMYLEAQIHLHNREYDDYNNAAMVYSSLLDEYKKWYIRENRPKSAGNFYNI